MMISFIKSKSLVSIVHWLVLVLLVMRGAVDCYCISNKNANINTVNKTRRCFLTQAFTRFSSASAAATFAFAFAAVPKKSYASGPAGNESSKISSVEELIKVLQDASDTLEKLLNNWDKATIDCTYADVPRDLLETKNKELLLDKASTFALFDKSVVSSRCIIAYIYYLFLYVSFIPILVLFQLKLCYFKSVVSCKKSNKIVRDYIGATGKGPLVGIDKSMNNRKLFDALDPDNLDEYIGQTELFSQALAKATSLSYTAGVADFDSINNFQEGAENSKVSSLDEAKSAIEEAHSALKSILALLAV